MTDKPRYTCNNKPHYRVTRATQPNYNKVSPRGRLDDMPRCRWQFDGGIPFRRQSGRLRQFMDPKIAADLRPSADRSAVRASLVAGGG